MLITWLEANKVFFEVISSILVGTASLVVAFASYRIYKQQLFTAKLQLDASKTEFKPHFSVQAQNVFDDDHDHVKQIDFFVFNYGAPAYNISVDHKTFLKVFWQSPNANDGLGGRKEFYIPMTYYLFGTYVTGEPQGLIVRKSGDGNREKYMNLKSELSEAVGFTVFFSAQTIISISGENRLGEQFAEYFYNTSKIDRSEIDNLLAISQTEPGFSLGHAESVEVLKKKIIEAET